MLDELVAMLRVRGGYLYVWRDVQAKVDASLGMGGGILELPSVFSGPVDGVRRIRGGVRANGDGLRLGDLRGKRAICMNASLVDCEVSN